MFVLDTLLKDSEHSFVRWLDMGWVELPFVQAAYKAFWSFLCETSLRRSRLLSEGFARLSWGSKKGILQKK